MRPPSHQSFREAKRRIADFRLQVVVGGKPNQALFVAADDSMTEIDENSIESAKEVSGNT